MAMLLPVDAVGRTLVGAAAADLHQQVKSARSVALVGSAPWHTPAQRATKLSSCQCPSSNFVSIVTNVLTRGLRLAIVHSGRSSLTPTCPNGILGLPRHERTSRIRPARASPSTIHE